MTFNPVNPSSQYYDFPNVHVYYCYRAKLNELLNGSIGVFGMVYQSGHLTSLWLQVDQNLLTPKIAAVPKIGCHQNYFGTWKVIETLLGEKGVLDIFLKKNMVNHINTYSTS